MITFCCAQFLYIELILWIKDGLSKASLLSSVVVLDRHTDMSLSSPKNSFPTVGKLRGQTSVHRPQTLRAFVVLFSLSRTG